MNKIPFHLITLVSDHYTNVLMICAPYPPPSKKRISNLPQSPRRWIILVLKLIYSVDDVQNRCLFTLRARGQKRKSVNISDLRKFHVFCLSRWEVNDTESIYLIVIDNELPLKTLVSDLSIGAFGNMSTQKLGTRVAPSESILVSKVRSDYEQCYPF